MNDLNYLIYPCPCCGYIVFVQPPGSFDICPICFWEDDLSQLRFPMTTGANQVSLIEGQKNFLQFGACESRCVKWARPPDAEDYREKTWRPIDLTQDNIEEAIPGQDYGFSYPRDTKTLYYWSGKYWRGHPR